MAKKCIFIVEDDQDLLFIYNLILKEQYIVYQFEQADEEFFTLLEKKKPALILLDWLIPSLNADLVIEAVKNIDSNVKVLIISALNDIQELVSDKEADAVLQKPVHMHVMQNVIKDLINSNTVQGQERAA